VPYLRLAMIMRSGGSVKNWDSALHPAGN